MRSPERQRTMALLDSLDLVPVTERIAATALDLGLDLATLNVKHFPMFRGLRPPFRP